MDQNYAIKLNNEKDIGSFVEDMKDLFGDKYNIRAVDESGEINLSQITKNIALVMIMLCLTFMIITFIILFNTTMMEIYTNKKELGIYRALGMTSMQIRATILYKALALSTIGMVLGTILALILSSHILSILITNMGMAQFPFDITVLGTLGVMPICIIVIAISSWVPSRKIMLISPRNLVMD